MSSTERARMVAGLRDAGLTYAEIGAELGVSKQRAFQILHPQGQVSEKRATELELLRKEWRSRRTAASTLEA